MIELVAYLAMPMVLTPATDWHVHFLKYAWMKGVLFFSVGIYLRWNENRIGRFVLGLVFVAGCVAFGRGGMDLIFVLTVMIGLWYAVPSSQWPRQLTSCAFPVFLLHHFVLVLLIAGYRIGGVKDAISISLAAYLVQIPVVVACCMAITLWLRKSCPTVVRIIFGGR